MRNMVEKLMGMLNMTGMNRFSMYLCSSHDMHGVCIDYFLRGVEAYSLIVCLRPPFYHFL